MRTRNGMMLAAGLLAAGLGVWQPAAAWAQSDSNQPASPVERVDAQRTKDELSRLLDHYPPTLRNVLAMDPTLLTNQTYLAPYAGLTTFLKAHPEIERNATFFLGEPPHEPRDAGSRAAEMWRSMYESFSVFAGFALAAGILIWLVHTLIDFRRWSRLAKVQTDVHTKLLDRFTANDDLLAYIQSPAGSSFLQSSPIKLDAAPRSIGAPLGRILWSLQGGLVLMAGGVGLHMVAGRVRSEAGQPLYALGVLAIALGIGFVVSAMISYVISQRLGLIEGPGATQRTGTPNV